MRRYVIGLMALLALVFSSLGFAAGSRGTGGDGPSGAAPGTSIALGRCSKTTAVQVATRFHVGVDPFIGRTPIFQVLCGPFLGPGSQGMVASVAVPTGCGGSLEWAVFRFASGTWQLVMERKNGAFLSAIGSDIREKVGAPRSGDPPCSPSAWKSRIWHWNGTRFTATPWKRVSSGTSTAPGAFKYGYFKTPSGNIQCDYGYGGNARAYVRCGIKSGLKPAPPSRGPRCFQAPWLSLGATGRADLGPSTCPGEDAPDAGPFAGAGVGRVLGYGKTWTGGGLRCTSAVAGLTCRNKSGHGFFLSRETWRAF